MFAFSNNNLNDDNVFAQLEALADIDNLLKYYAFQIWLGNTDWPHDNLYRWRYTGEPFAGMAPELDGRWRYAMFGLDNTLGLVGGDYTRPTLHRLLSPDNFEGALLAAILQREDMAHLFAEILREMMDEVLNYETVREVLEELYSQIENELGFAMAAGLLDGGVTRGTIAEHHESTLLFAQNRHIYILESLDELLFGTEDEEEETHD
jgi:hypothetical protein